MKTFEEFDIDPFGEEDWPTEEPKFPHKKLKPIVVKFPKKTKKFSQEEIEKIIDRIKAKNLNNDDYGPNAPRSFTLPKESKVREYDDKIKDMMEKIKNKKYIEVRNTWHKDFGNTSNDTFDCNIDGENLCVVDWEGYDYGNDKTIREYAVYLNKKDITKKVNKKLRKEASKLLRDLWQGNGKALFKSLLRGINDNI